MLLAPTMPAVKYISLELPFDSASLFREAIVSPARTGRDIALVLLVSNGVAIRAGLAC